MQSNKELSDVQLTKIIAGLMKTQVVISYETAKQAEVADIMLPMFKGMKCNNPGGFTHEMPLTEAWQKGLVSIILPGLGSGLQVVGLH